MSKRLAFTLSVLTIFIMASFIYFNFDELKKSGITGYQVMSTRLVIISENATTCDTTFEAGWNLISFPCVSGDTNIELFLASLNNSYQSIRYYTPLDIDDPWKSYNPSLPSWAIQDLSLISRRDGYWMYFENQTYVYINNSLATPTLTSLTPGWNLIGYPSRTIRTVNETFYQLIPNYDYVHMYNASDQVDKWKEYTWNTSLPSAQDLNYTLYYYGYWIYVISPDTLLLN